MGFVHLHNHTDYSALDGAITVKKLVERTLELGMNSVAMTDHGNMCGAIEFYKEARAKGVKPILGQEFYIAPNSRFDKTAVKGEETAYHLVLLAENAEGYKNLMRLSSIGFIDGFYYKPRIDFETLSAHSKGLICSSACIGGEIPYLILQNKPKEARIASARFKELFGRDRYYLELQDHGFPEQKKANAELIKIASELDLPLIATNDCHYLKKDDAYAHEVLLCIQTGKTMSDENRMKFGSNEFYLKSPEEMELLFAEYPDALFNTEKIAEMCNVELKLDNPVLPTFVVPGGHTLNSFMKELVYTGAEKRYGSPIPSNVIERIEYELSVIFNMDFAGYFLIVWDFINYAKNNDIPVGPGRGSAAGSIASYCMGITQLNPLDYNLLFERFLNPDRKEMPDMDIDFCGVKRELVIDYVKKKYGEDHVSQIMAFNTLQPKAAVKDVARALDIPFNESNKITKLIDPKAKTLDEAIKNSKELKDFVNSSELTKKLFDTSKKLEGLVRSFGKHAAGVVISKEKLTEYAPLYRDQKDGSIATQYDKIYAESAGLVKMDFLGLKNLTIIDNAIKMIQHNHDKNFDIEKIPLDDKKTYQLLQKADTNGIFQLESSGMQNLIRRLGPTVFDDIIACGALYRPGPLESGMVDQYIQRKRNAKLIQYPHPVLEPVLNDTLGVIIYQEQVMKISQVMGGFTMGEADKLRKAMGKKKADIVNDMRDKFLKGAKEKKIDPKIAEDVYNAMSKFAEYGFNKSHAAAYGLVTYQTAFLKTHYRTEYMCALLSATGDQKDITKYISDCRSTGIQVLPPNVNYSVFNFSISEDKQIRFGLNAVKGIGEKVIEGIIEAREKSGTFKSIQDFLERVDPSALNKGAFESLIKAGAFSDLESNRAKLFASIDLLSEISRKLQQDKKSGQGNLFGGDSGSDTTVQLPEIQDWPDNVKLAFEKEILGLYASGHPLEKYEKEIRAFSSCSTTSLEEKAKNGVQSVSLAGIIENPVKRISKKGKPYMTAVLEDMEGSVEIFIFEKILNKYETLIMNKSLVMITGKLEIDEGMPGKILVEEIITLKDARNKAISAIHINIDPVGLDESAFTTIRDLMEKNRGDIPVFFHVHTGVHTGEKIVRAHSSINVSPSESFIGEILNLLGSEALRYSFKSCF